MVAMEERFMQVYEIKKYTDIQNIEMKKNDQFIINLTDTDLKERQKIMCFLSGLTFLKGKFKKQNKDEFLIKL